MDNSRFGYQVREIGKASGNSWNATQDTTCVEWAESPEGKEVVITDNVTGEEHVMSNREAQQVANNYKKLLASLRNN